MTTKKAESSYSYWLRYGAVAGGSVLGAILVGGIIAPVGAAIMVGTTYDYACGKPNLYRVSNQLIYQNKIDKDGLITVGKKVASDVFVGGLVSFAWADYNVLSIIDY